MNRRMKLLATGAVAAAALALGGGIAVASGGETDTPIPANEIDRASAVALEHTGQGHVSDTEVGDEEGYYEVEVTLDDGSQVDVHLDRDFNVLETIADSDSADEK
jgi:Peptidase propeptide and YPEB domain